MFHDRNAFISNPKRFARVHETEHAPRDLVRARYCPITFAGIAARRFPRARIENRAAVDIADQLGFGGVDLLRT
jgi:hypothetical protein